MENCWNKNFSKPRMDAKQKPTADERRLTQTISDAVEYPSPFRSPFSYLRKSAFICGWARSFSLRAFAVVLLWACRLLAWRQAENVRHRIVGIFRPNPQTSSQGNAHRDSRALLNFAFYFQTVRVLKQAVQPAAK